MILRTVRFVPHLVKSAVLPVFCGFLPIGLAVSPGTENDARAETPPEKTEQWNDEALARLEESGRLYRSLKSYEDKIVSRHVIIKKDEDGEEWPQESETEGQFRFVAPDKFALTTEHSAIISDGKSLTLYAGYLGQYRVQASPDRDYSKLNDGENRMVSLATHPVAMLLASEKQALPDAFPMIRSVDRLMAEQLNGKSGVRIHGSLEWERAGEESLAPFSVLLDESGLLRELRVDLTKFITSQNSETDRGEEDVGEDDDPEEDDLKQPTIVKAEHVISFSDIKLNDAIADEHFVFTAPEDARKVDEFSWASPGAAAQLRLVGKPAPGIEGKTLDGRDFSLAGLKGKVVVLDFWATWCAPCVRSLPDLQKLSDRFANEPVAVIGINKDFEGAAKQVLKLLDKKKVTVPQFADAKQEISEAYHVSGIPSVALIDKEGNLQDIRMNFDEENLADDILSLIQGKQLHTQEDIEEQLADLSEDYDLDSKAVGNESEAEDEMDEEEDEERDHSKSRKGKLDVLAPERLVKGDELSDYVNTWRARLVDVERDAAPELVLPDMRGSLVIVSSDGSTERRLRFKGCGYGQNIQNFEPVRYDGSLWWLLSLSRHSGTGMAQKSSVGLFDEKGSCVWSYQPELPKKNSSQMSATAADLNGDGIPEIIINLMTFKMRSEGDNTWMHVAQRGYLLVLDWAGNVLSQRKVGGHSDFVAVLPGTDAIPPTIIASDHSGLRRFFYDEDAEPAERSK